MIDKILFLDIDGVLNYNQYYVRGRREGNYPVTEICPVAIQNLQRIIEATNCSIVISSTWRHSGIEYCRNVLRECKLVCNIVDITPDIHYEWSQRGNEIRKWLIDNQKYKYDEYTTPNHDYAILDDDNDMLYQQRHNFFECDPDTGLTEEIANKVIQFLTVTN